MKFGGLTNPSKDILEEVKRISKWADYVEIGIEPPAATPERVLKYKKDILKILNEKGIYAIAHFTWFADFSTSLNEVRKAWIKEAKKAIKVAAQLKIRKFNVHASSLGMARNSKYKNEALNNIITSLKDIVRFSKKFKIEIMIENTPASDGFEKFKDFKYIVDNVPGLKVHLDIGHAYTIGGLKEVERYLKTFKGKVAHIHVSDNHGKKDEHLQIGDGKIKWKKVMYLLKKYGYDGSITPEVFKGKGGARRGAQLLKKLLQ